MLSKMVFIGFFYIIFLCTCIAEGIHVSLYKYIRQHYAYIHKHFMHKMLMQNIYEMCCLINRNNGLIFQKKCNHLLKLVFTSQKMSSAESWTTHLTTEREKRSINDQPILTIFGDQWFKWCNGWYEHFLICQIVNYPGKK